MPDTGSQGWSWPQILVALGKAGFTVVQPVCLECQGHGFTTLTVHQVYETPHQRLGWGGQSSTPCAACRGQGLLPLAEALALLPPLSAAPPHEETGDGEGGWMGETASTAPVSCPTTHSANATWRPR